MDDFCYICCENEFGRMHQDKREDCYVMCDAFAVQKADGETICRDKQEQDIKKKE